MLLAQLLNFHQRPTTGFSDIGDVNGEVSSGFNFTIRPVRYRLVTIGWKVAEDRLRNRTSYVTIRKDSTIFQELPAELDLHVAK